MLDELLRTWADWHQRTYLPVWNAYCARDDVLDEPQLSGMVQKECLSPEHA